MSTQITPQEIEKAVTATFNTNIRKLMKPSEEKHIATPRHILFMLLTEINGLSARQIQKKYKYYSDIPGMYKCIRRATSKVIHNNHFRQQYTLTINTLNTIINQA